MSKKSETALVAAIEIRTDGPHWVADVALGTQHHRIRHRELRKAVKEARRWIENQLMCETVR